MNMASEIKNEAVGYQEKSSQNWYTKVKETIQNTCKDTSDQWTTFHVKCSKPLTPKDAARLLLEGFDLTVKLDKYCDGETIVAWLMARQDRRGLLIIDAPEAIGKEYKEEVDLALNELGVRPRNVDDDFISNKSNGSEGAKMFASPEEL